MTNIILPPQHRDPGFGWDPWVGPGTPPIAEGKEARKIALADVPADLVNPKGLPIYTGCDGFEIGIMPDGLNIYGSYVDGYGGYNALVNRFLSSGAFLYSISVLNNPAREADVEPRAMVNGQLPVWYPRAVNDKLSVPWVYTSASNMQGVIDSMGGRSFIKHSAHYGFGPHICGPGTCGYPQADWTQWTDSGPNGENYDRSVGYYLPNTHPTPPPPPVKSTDLTAGLVHNWVDGNWTATGTGNPTHIKFNPKNDEDWVAVGVNTHTGVWTKPVPLPHNWTPPKS